MCTKCKRVNGFKENSIAGDTEFSTKAKPNNSSKQYIHHQHRQQIKTNKKVIHFLGGKIEIKYTVATLFRFVRKRCVQFFVILS